MGRLIDLTGRRFSYLLVIERVYPEGKNRKRIYWRCICNCGKETIVDGNSLRGKLTHSCGCYGYSVGKITGLKKLKEPIPYSTLYHRIKRGAKLRKISFNLSIEQFKELISKDCYLCGSPPSTIWKKQSKVNPLAKDLYYNGIDRVDSNIGYEINNCQTCCWRCNMMKRELPLQNFINRVLTISNRYSKGLIL